MILFFVDETHLYAVLQAVDNVPDWYTLGICLGFQDSVLRRIKEDTLCQTEPGRKKMITKWLNEGRATKEALIKAIRGMKLLCFAENYSDIDYQSMAHISVPLGRLFRKINTDHGQIK